MPIIPKVQRDRAIKELVSANSELIDVLNTAKDLTSDREGCKPRLYWKDPSAMCSIDKINLDLAIGRVNILLITLKKLK